MPDARGRFMKGEHWRPVQIFRDKEWLEREYVEKQRSAADIAAEFGVGDTAIQFWLRKHGIPRRSVAQARQAKHWGSFGEDNPMYGIRGPASRNWKHGRTPERQAFYASAEWSAVVRQVWARDKALCRRCEAKPVRRSQFHVHHIVSFGVRELRAAPFNLVLLCPRCHRWVHGRENQSRLFLGQKGGVL